MNSENLTVAPLMVLFHSEEKTPLGIDREFTIPIKEFITRTRDFDLGLCLKTVLHIHILNFLRFIHNNKNG